MESGPTGFGHAARAMTAAIDIIAKVPKDVILGADDCVPVPRSPGIFTVEGSGATDALTTHWSFTHVPFFSIRQYASLHPESVPGGAAATW
jgi:hypothetical protein